MKSEVTPTMMIGAGVAALVLIGLIAWWIFAANNTTVDTATINSRIAAKAKKHQ